MLLGVAVRRLNFLAADCPAFVTLTLAKAGQGGVGLPARRGVPPHSASCTCAANPGGVGKSFALPLKSPQNGLGDHAVGHAPSEKGAISWHAPRLLLP
mmetsp:Transcript_54207/g.107664  ORF Transcript_54207/g.107664 Transcript_54207/m.107664 type:complete len:98 (+) Transcript_54207:215-508(+)